MRKFIVMLLLWVPVVSALGAEGLVVIESNHSVGETGDRLVAALETKGMNVFARIDHAAGAAGAGLELPDTELVIFGNPKVGTPLMLCARTVAIDLPQKALIWKDADGKVWLGYNDPAFLDQRHQLGDNCQAVLAKVSKALGAFATAATAP